MTFSTFSPPVAPKVEGAPQTATARMMSAKFGDGYSQESPDGLNSVSSRVSVSWPPMTLAESSTIYNFFAGQKGMPFKWTVPGEDAPRQFRCKTWTRDVRHRRGAGSATITAEFEEDFSL